MRALLDRLRHRRRPRALIMLGIDYGCHQWYLALQAEKRYRITAFIDDEPWNHRTRIGDAPVQYPSELTALIAKHDACAVVQVDGAVTPTLDSDTRRELARLKIPLLRLPAQLSAQPSRLLDTLRAREQQA